MTLTSKEDDLSSDLDIFSPTAADTEQDLMRSESDISKLVAIGRKTRSTVLWTLTGSGDSGE